MYSAFDDINLVWEVGDKAPTDSPEGFVVNPEEINSLLGPMKFSWKIFADSRNYYLSPLDNLLPLVGNTSYHAKNNGIQICGTERKQYESLKGKVGEQGAASFGALKQLAGDSQCQ